MVQVYASTDNKADANDTLVTTVPVRLKLNPGATRALKVKLLLPQTLTPGETYYLIAKIDSDAVLPDPVKPASEVTSGPLVF
jgi:hypothetical protein